MSRLFVKLVSSAKQTEEKIENLYKISISQVHWH